MRQTKIREHLIINVPESHISPTKPGKQAHVYSAIPSEHMPNPHRAPIHSNTSEKKKLIIVTIKAQNLVST